METHFNNKQKGGNAGLVVMGGEDSCSKGREFIISLITVTKIIENVVKCIAYINLITCNR